MSLLDKFKEQATVVRGAAGDVAQNAVRQTKSLAAIGRIKIAIASEEDKVKKAYTELGRLFYRDYEAGTEATMEDYQPWCDKIAEAKAQIAQLNEDMAAARASSDDEILEAEVVPMDTGEETVLEEVIPDEIVPEESVPEKVAPEEFIPEEIIPEETGPVVDTLYVDESGSEE